MRPDCVSGFPLYSQTGPDGVFLEKAHTGTQSDRQQPEPAHHENTHSPTFMPAHEDTTSTEISKQFILLGFALRLIRDVGKFGEQ
jgi:hypothetical protein